MCPRRPFFLFSKSTRKRYLLAFLFTIVVGMIAFSLFEIYLPPSFESDPHIIYIPPNATTRQIAEILYENRLIKSPGIFRRYVSLRKLDRQLHSGEFELNGNLPMPDLIDHLMEKKGHSRLVRITIPEGFSIKKIARLLQDNRVVSTSDFLCFLPKAKAHFERKYEFLADVPTCNLEGYFFADTYLFAVGVTPEVVVDSFLKQFQKQVIPIWEVDGKLSKWTLHEILTLASMIEKEAEIRSEMPIISSVFHNRLKINMPLACDPTVMYALGEPDRGIVTYKDLRVNSIYNTYRNPGLPPTPIASPSLDAFKAALHPASTKYLFFVSNGDRTHTFSKNFRDHHRKIVRLNAKAARGSRGAKREYPRR